MSERENLPWAKGPAAQAEQLSERAGGLRESWLFGAHDWTEPVNPVGEQFLLLGLTALETAQRHFALAHLYLGLKEAK